MSNIVFQLTGNLFTPVYISVPTHQTQCVWAAVLQMKLSSLRGTFTLKAFFEPDILSSGWGRHGETMVAAVL